MRKLVIMHSKLAAADVPLFRQVQGRATKHCRLQGVTAYITQPRLKMRTLCVAGCGGEEAYRAAVGPSGDHRGCCQPSR